MKVQAAVKKETGYVLVTTALATVIMMAAFYLLHRSSPEQIPFDYRVILGGILGCCVAVLNFFMMAVTVQKIVSMEDQDRAFRTMRVSYRYRTMLQMGWVLLAILLPFIQFAAGILPLFFPSVFIKLKGIRAGIKG